MKLSRPAKGEHFTEGSRLLWLYMAEHGISQTELARRIGTESGHVSHWLYGHRRPGVKWMFRVEDAIGVPARSWAESAPKGFRIPGKAA